MRGGKGSCRRIEQDRDDENGKEDWTGQSSHDGEGNLLNVTISGTEWRRRKSAAVSRRGE